jgi:anaerobic magnesium-protoporphyrin IX monomethyl ester cyclase
MNIKIIEPYRYDKRYDVRSLTPSLGPVMVASLLKGRGHEVEVVSEYVTKLDPEELNRADLVGISITTYNAKRGFEIARHVRKPVVFGGFHASLMPEECLRYGDHVIRGDGHPVADLADLLSGKRGTLRAIPNLVYKESGRAVYNRTEAKTMNIVPDFGLVKDYYKLNVRRLLRIPLLVHASRGCPCRCTFCSIKAVYPDFKKKDVEVVVQDIKNQVAHQPFLSRFFPRIVWITDDNFSSDKKWAKELMKAIARIKTGYRFVIQARADVAEDEELLDLMAEANIGIVYLGIESLSQSSLNHFRKDLSQEEIVDAIRKLQARGIQVHGLWVFGADEFQKGDGLRVAEFVKKHSLSGVLIQPLIPFPGTEVFDQLKTEGRLLHEDWEYYDGKVVFVPKNMTAAELQKEIYDCYREVFSPWRIFRFLVFGPRGFRLAGLGEGWFRQAEWRKRERYIRERLM